MSKKTSVICSLLFILSLWLVYYFANGTGDSKSTQKRQRAAERSSSSISQNTPPKQTAKVEIVVDPELEKVKTAWKERESRTLALRCRWEAETVWPKGQSMGYPGILMTGLTALTEDATIEENLECTFDGNFFRFSHDGPKWIIKADRFMPRLQLKQYSNQEKLSFSSGDDLDGRLYHPNAIYSEVDRTNESYLYQLEPLLLVYRPFDENYKQVRVQGNFQLAEKNSKDPEEDSLVINKVAFDESRIVRTFWIDKNRDFLPTRIESKRDGNLMSEIDINYRQDKNKNWVPENWKISLYSLPNDIHTESRLFVSTKAQVMECIENPKLSERDFDFVLPGNTWVSDHRSDESYLLRPDGSKRYITEEESTPDVTYERLVATESGEGVTAEYKSVADKIKALKESPDELKQGLINDISHYYELYNNKEATFYLARRASFYLNRAGDTEAAANTLRAIAYLLGNDGKGLSQMADEFAGAARLDDSLENVFVITGRTLDDKPFDNHSTQGKVLLVTFWNRGCRSCIEEFSLLKEIYETYHPQGFEIVGITSDKDAEKVTALLNEHKVPWLNIYNKDEEQQSTIKRYGITTLPTNVLIDREGKVKVITHDAAGLSERVAELITSDAP